MACPQHSFLRRAAMQLDRKSILAAVGVVIREGRAAQAKVNDELRNQIVSLQERFDALEQRGSPRSLRAVPDKDSMIA